MQNRPKLDQIEPPLTDFRFANKRLASAEPLGELHLSQVGRSSRLAEQSQEGSVLVGVDRFFHARHCDEAARMLKSVLA